ncbi:hypothetical protein GCM10027596_28920 [Nocardioides korecus]
MAGVVRGTLGRVVAAVVRWVRAAPVATAYAALLLATTVLLRLAPVDLDDQVLIGSSTDVTHLLRDPALVMVASALFLPGATWLPDGLVLLTIGRSLERRVGSGRTVLVMIAGHVVGTVLTEGPIAVGVALHRLPASWANRLDVGASYALVAVVAALVGLLPRLARVPVFVVGAVLVAGVPELPPDMTAWGHLIAAATGVCWWHHLRRCGSPPSAAAARLAGEEAPDARDAPARRPAR